jgi:trehalose synthase
MPETIASGEPETSMATGDFRELTLRETIPDKGLLRVQTNPDNLDMVDLYERKLGALILDSLRTMASELKNVRVAHVNATAFGGGVAELLHRQIPLMNQLGEAVNFRTDWFILNVDNPAFYDMTKKCHNSLQGASGQLLPEERDQYYRTLLGNYGNGQLADYDVVFIHDPQPAGLIELYPNRRNQWVWRCHIDTSTPNPEVWNFFSRFVREYDMAIWTRDSFVHEREILNKVRIIAPSIDPISPKNSDLFPEEIEAILLRYGIDPRRPILLQVSRFDPWKQPLEVIQVYQDLKAEFPGLQLLLCGSMATDDPEALQYWEKSLRKAGLDENVFILTNYHNVGNREINAFQRAAHAVLQYSSKEGFGLTVSEGMWKFQPVIGGRVGGIQDQIVHEENGFLVTTPEEVKNAVRLLLTNPKRRQEMGASAHLRVAENFLITREIADYLQVIYDLRLTPVESS